GGQEDGYSFHDTSSVLNPELWNPATGQFTVMAAEAEPRNYHSVAVLLPNGEVFSGGGGLCGSGCGANHPDGQIFSPPYLFNSDGTPATRPVIESAPTSAVDGQTITVTTDNPASTFSLVRYGEATHAADDDQRLIPLPVQSQTGNTYQLTIPSDPGVVLPGPYMLFAMNAQGTPSIASTVMVSDVSSAPADTFGQAVVANDPAIYWPLADTSGSPAADASGNEDTGNYSSTGVTYGAQSPVEGTSGSGVSLDGASGDIKASQPYLDKSATYSESMWFQTTDTSGGYLMSLANSTLTKFDHQVWMTSSGQLEVGSSGTGGMSNFSPSSYNDGNWHFAVVVGLPKKTELYVDGQLVAEASASKPAGFLGSWMIGSGGPSTSETGPADSFFQGTVSDAALFDYSLNSSEIQSLFQASGTN
ncbi:MAG: galactose oxidase-like domain-containing protein, partial [Acidimicrobiales bacterium]